VKVLHFFKTYYPNTQGGIEQVIYQIAEGVAANGVKSDVLYLSPCGSGVSEQIGHHTAHSAKLDLEFASTGFSLSAFSHFKRLSQKADIIHYHFPWPFMDLVHFACCPANKPAVVSYHSDIVKQKKLLRLYKPLMYRFLNGVQAVVAASPDYVDSSPVLQQLGDKVRVIPYGLDRATYPVVTDQQLTYWRNRVGERFFLFVGALRYYKGLHFLLQAAKLTRLPVVLLGKGTEEGALKAEAARLGLTQVHFVGALDDADKSALLQLCTAFVFPSHLRSEAFGIALLEAAMFGKPLISCAIGTGTTFINIGDETGLVVPPADPQALASAMKTLWQDEDLCKRFGAQARQRYEMHFSAKKMATAYTRLYQELLLRS
jgi:rhamnosyl/mannosyltransferase